MTDKLKVVFVGHVDHGKSTLIGRLLYDTKSIPEDKINDLKTINGTQEKYDFAFLMDHFEEERKQGITIDTTQVFFKSKNKEYVIIDSPGHIEFIVNMITGAAQADIAILIIDAMDGIQEQTKRHAFVLSLLGIKQIVLAVNKMDLVEYNEDIYKNIVKRIVPFLQNLHIKNVIAVPICALNGDNVTFYSNNMHWYQGQTLLDLLDELEIRNTKSKNDTIFSVQDVYSVFDHSGRKRIIVGKVESGAIKKNQNITILPSGEHAKIESIEVFNKKTIAAHKNESVGIIVSKPLFVDRGNIIVGSQKDKPCIASSVKATIFWMGNHAGKIGKSLILRCSTQEVNCHIDIIYNKINSSTLEKIENGGNCINKLEVCEVGISVKQPLVASEFYSNDALSRFILMGDNNVVAIGFITYISGEK